MRAWIYFLFLYPLSASPPLDTSLGKKTNSSLKSLLSYNSCFYMSIVAFEIFTIALQLLFFTCFSSLIHLQNKLFVFNSTDNTSTTIFNWPCKGIFPLKISFQSFWYLSYFKLFQHFLYFFLCDTIIGGVNHEPWKTQFLLKLEKLLDWTSKDPRPFHLLSFACFNRYCNISNVYNSRMQNTIITALEV